MEMPEPIGRGILRQVPSQAQDMPQNDGQRTAERCQSIAESYNSDLFFSANSSNLLGPCKSNL